MALISRLVCFGLDSVVTVSAFRDAASGWEDHPVREATWDGARAYCAWRGARLPTEVEWEAVARGRSGRTYPWGEARPLIEHAVFGRGSGQTAPVGSHPAGATPEGVHHLAGNVAEWTSTLYRPYPYDANDGREDPNIAGERVTRGGDHVFDSAPEQLTGFFRSGFSRRFNRGHRHIGFREDPVLRFEVSWGNSRSQQPSTPAPPRLCAWAARMSTHNCATA